MLGFIPMFSFEYQISIHSAENPARQGSSETAPVMMKEIAFSTGRLPKLLNYFVMLAQPRLNGTRIESCGQDRSTTIA
jgi:hypothetical protein